MIKQIYGCKDVPRAWRKKLHQVFVGWLSCRQLHTEPEAYCVHTKESFIECDILTRAKEHNEEQQEIGRTRNTEPQA